MTGADDEDIDAVLEAQPFRGVFEDLVRRCRLLGVTLSIAESMTAGEIALTIASIPDSGPVLDGRDTVRGGGDS